MRPPAGVDAVVRVPDRFVLYPAGEVFEPVWQAGIGHPEPQSLVVEALTNGTSVAVARARLDAAMQRSQAFAEQSKPLYEMLQTACSQTPV